MIAPVDFSRKKPSIFKRVCLKIARTAFCEDESSPDCGAEISLARRAAWLLNELNMPWESQGELVFRIEYNGVHIQMVQASESTTNVTIHFPTIGEDGKYLQCSWAFTYSRFSSFCTITAAINSAVLMADKYYNRGEND